MKARSIMSNSAQEIYERMRDSLQDGAAAIEGTFSGNNMLAVANELARTYSQDVEPILPRAFAASAGEEDLDRIGADINLPRKAATYAEVMVTIQGEPGWYSDILAAADSIVFQTGDFQIGESGSAEVRAVCLTAGSIGNVQPGTIRDIKTNGVTLTSVKNEAAAAEGYDEEPDEQYRKRILAKKQKVVTGGNREQYRQWSVSVEGVSKAKVIDLYDGPGTVGVFLVAEGNTTASPDLIEKVSEYIESVRPCGADASVMSAEAVQISVAAAVVLYGTDTENTKAEFTGLLEEYLQDIPFSEKKKTTVSYMRIADLLLKVEGVEDIHSITVNGAASSVILGETQFPVAGLVEITAAEEVQND